MKILSRFEELKPQFLQQDSGIQVEYLLNDGADEDPKSFFEGLRKYLTNSNPNEILIITNHTGIDLYDSKQNLLAVWEQLGSHIVFGASADFNFENEALRYYYWKFYPRQQTVYDFVDQRFLMGKTKDLLAMVNDVIAHFDLDGSFSIADVFHRIYVDTQSQQIGADYEITLDHQHELVGSTVGWLTAVKWPLVSKIHSFLFFQNEKRSLSERGLLTYQRFSRDYSEKNSRPFNRKTKTVPPIFMWKEKHTLRWSFRAWTVSLFAYFRSLGQLFMIAFHNHGNFSQDKLFRYARNRGKEVHESMEIIMELLRTKQPFSFSHFNDGEMTFIKKYLNKDHKEVWFGGTLFGRFQDQYNQKLGELLVDSFEMRQKNYFIGTPCKSCHPRLHAFANEARKSDPFTIPAMTFHHNLSYYPEILGQVKERKTYFVVNPYQDLSFFKNSGFKIGENQHIKVPFKNAHNEYENLKELKFEEGSVVLLMCGMLAKILCAHWFKNQPNVTYIAFGSSFDDFIQENINFKIYPKEYPFSRHIIGSRGYLFGAKPRCEVCFDLGNSTSQIQ